MLRLGEAGGPHAFTLEALRRMFAPRPPHVLPASAELIEERLRWETEDVRPRAGVRASRGSRSATSTLS